MPAWSTLSLFVTCLLYLTKIPSFVTKNYGIIFSKTIVEQDDNKLIT